MIAVRPRLLKYQKEDEVTSVLMGMNERTENEREGRGTEREGGGQEVESGG